MKTCNRCSLEKPLTCFNTGKGPDGKHIWCKPCVREYDRNRFKSVKKKRVEQVGKRRRELRDWVRGLKEGRACVRCGESHPATLDFHHRDPDEKRRHVADMVSTGMSKEAILTEIEKCDLICSNCHRKEHWNE